MNGREFWALRDISNEALEASLGSLLGAGARLEARIIAHLAEVEERRLHLLAGYSSLYDYCRKRLRLSDYEAFARIAAARAAWKYPVIFELLEQRTLHLTAICEVREFLTPENHRELLEEISGQTKLQIREALARRFPRRDVPTSVKKLPTLDPLSPGRYRLQLTLSADQKAKLEQARDLLSHANPHGDLAIVVERALDELISRLEKRRFGQRPAPMPKDKTLANGTLANEALANEALANEALANEALANEALANEAPANETFADEGLTRRRKHIRQAVRRELVTRDGARCSFVSDDGRRCEERGFLQVHHRQPWARGGEDTANNLSLLCQAHNHLLAEQEFGRAHIEQSIARRGASPTKPA